MKGFRYNRRFLLCHAFSSSVDFHSEAMLLHKFILSCCCISMLLFAFLDGQGSLVSIIVINRTAFSACDFSTLMIFTYYCAYVRSVKVVNAYVRVLRLSACACVMNTWTTYRDIDR